MPIKNLVWLCLLLFPARLALGKPLENRSAAEIEGVRVVPSGDKTKIEIKLSEFINPRVVIATNPDRLVLELPNTLTAAKQQHISVNQVGIKGVRVGLTSTAPLMSRLVVDLESARPYGLAIVGNTIALTVLPTPAGREGNPRSPVAIASGDGALSGITVTDVPAMSKAASKPLQLGFKVKYVAEGVVYLSGGRAAGLEPGMTLGVLDSKKGGRLHGGDESTPVAELRVISVAETSAVTEVHGAKRDVRPGDWAYLSAEATDALMQKRSFSNGRRKVASSLGSGTVSQSALMQTTREPIPDISEPGRVRARVGLDYSAISGSIGNSTQMGVVARADITHIAGSHWNLEGYWRGRITRHSRTEEDTLENVLNKTYTMQLYYDNPASSWVAGFGRLYLPWASSLDTIDGGYVGRRLGRGITAGIFAGSTPDPTSWHYNPDQQIGGSFINFEGNRGEAIHYTSTTGIAMNALKWQLDHPFVFFENGVSYKNTVSVYHSLIVDAPQGLTTNGITPGAGISRSYLTLHVQPYRRVSFDFYHNYFRDVPTAATALIGTGLVDKLLYQGVSFGVRVEPVKHYFVYTTLGKSDKTGDPRQTLNQMYGFTVDDIAHTGLRADMRYSKFDSSFGRGDYKLLTLTRHLGDRVMWDAQFGMQNLISPFTANTNARFVDTSFDTNLWGRSFLQSGYTVVRGNAVDYNQWYLSLGYRFDGRPAGK